MYKLNFTDPTTFDFTVIEEVRLHFLIIANGLPNSGQLQDALAVPHELDRLLRFYINVFQYHIPRTSLQKDKVPPEDWHGRVSMLKVGFAGMANLAGHSEFIADRMLQVDQVVDELLKYWFAEDSVLKQFQPESVLTLRNLSTKAAVAEGLLNRYPQVVKESIRLICTCPNDPVSDDLVRFLGNMAELPNTGKFLIEKNLIIKLLPFLNEEFGSERRQLISHVLKTTFRNNNGLTVLEDPEIDILSYVLLPLAGNEEFTEDEYSSMPFDLQYLPSNNTRDPSGEVRFNLVATIVNLSSTKEARDIMRRNNVYLILRELHKFEQASSEGLAKTVELIEDWVSAVVLTDEV